MFLNWGLPESFFLLKANKFGYLMMNIRFETDLRCHLGARIFYRDLWQMGTTSKVLAQIEDD